jgi:RND family efflux transporter MFP subunit
MPRHRTAALAGLAAALAVAGCGRSKSGPPPQKAPAVTVVRPGTAPVVSYWEYNGYLEEVEKVDVRARVKGFLNRINFREGTEVTGQFKWVNGDTLYPGDLLYQIDKREYLTAKAKAEADLAKAKADVLKADADIENYKAQVSLARVELKRAEEAVSRAAESRTALDKAKSVVDVNLALQAAAEGARGAAAAAVDSAAAAVRTADIQLGYTDVRAKVSGRINRTLVTEGNLVGQADPTLLTTIVRVNELYVYFDAPEADLVAYQRASSRLPQPDPTSQTIDVEVKVETEDGYLHRGKIDFRENRVETSTGTVRIRGRIPNPPGPTGERELYPGLFARVRVPSGAPVPQLVLPEDALMAGQEGRFVYVVAADGTVAKRIVKVGPTVFKAPPPEPGVAAPGWVMVNPNPGPPPEKGPPPPTRRPVKSVVAITDGLKPDDRVVVEGMQKARPGAPAAAEEWRFEPPADRK